MRMNILVGGKAGQGPNVLAHVLAEALIKKGFYVFYSRDYQSVIRGGHNFNVLTFSSQPVYSNDSKIDIIIALDEETLNIHRNSLHDKAIIVKGAGDSAGNMFFAGKIFKILGIEFSVLEEELKKLGKKVEENLREASKGYHSMGKIFDLEDKSSLHNKVILKNGNKGVADGAIKSGLDVYYAYPMTPATSLMEELASKQVENNHIVIEMENEIAVANAGVGSAITGAKTMVGTSGGGFDLMTEALSLAGIAEVPLVFFLSQRPGPATGVATYTAQGDLNMARHAGHGEFPRVIVAPGDPVEAEELTSEMFYFSQKFQVPSIILSDKHLGESFYTLSDMPKITQSGKWTSLRRYNSYEKDIIGSATEDPLIIKKNVEDRIRKTIAITEEAKKFQGYKIHGNKNSDNVIISWGSPKGVILDVLNHKEINAKFVQILYIEPFPKEQLWKEILGKNIILIENNSSAQMNCLLREKIGFNVPPKNIILRYDGRPFLKDELEKEIKMRVRR